MKNVLWAMVAVLSFVGIAEQPDLFVDYVQATTTNHFIDTGLVNAGDYKADLTFQVDTLVTKTSILGCTDRKFQYVNSSSYFGYYYLGTAKTLKDTAGNAVKVVKNTKYRLVSELAAGTQNLSVSKVTTGDVVATANGTDTTYTEKTAPLYLLNYYNENTKAPHASVSAVRLYGCKMWRRLRAESDYTLVRDFRPAVKDGRAGVWDAVEEKMYYSAGGEDLPCGSDTTCTWTGGGSTAKWSEAANWDVPPTGDRVLNLVFKPGEGTLTTENDLAGLKLYNLAVIGTNGTFNLTGHQKLTFYSYGNTAFSAVHSNLTLNVSTPMDFQTDASFKSRGNATFDGDFTFADGISFTMNPYWTDGGKSRDVYEYTFNGAFHGPAAHVEIACGANEARTSKIIFKQPVNIQEMTLGYSYLNNIVRFDASGNTIGKINATGHSIYFKKADPLTPGTVVNWFNCAGYVRTGTLYFQKDGGNTVTLDRIEGESSYNGSGKVPAAIGQTMRAETTSTLTTLDLHGTADATCYAFCYTGLSLVWDPVGDFTQEFRDRTHSMNGTITVKGGTFKSGGTNTFPKVSKVIVCDGARFVAESTLPFSQGTVALEMRGSGKLVLPEGTSCSFKSVTLDGVPVRGGDYVGVGAAGAGTQEATWLEGGAVVTAPEVTATYWNSAVDGNWGDAANWSDGLPSATMPGYVAAKGGDYTITVTAADAAPGTLGIVNAGPGTATVRLAGEVAGWKSVNCTLGIGGRLEIPEGATLNCDDSSARFTVDGGAFVVNGGLATFDGAEANNFSGAFSVTGDETHTGRVEVTAGALRYGPKSTSTSYKLKVKEYGRLEISGTGALQTCNGGNTVGVVDVDGGEFQMGGTGVYSSGDAANRKFCAILGTGRTVFSGSSQLYFNRASGTVSKFSITPGGAYETATVEFRDAARIDMSAKGANDGFVIGATGNATGILVFASNARHLTSDWYFSSRSTIASVTDATGIMRVEAGYVPMAGPRGILVGGSPRGLYGTPAVNTHGELWVSGGCCYLAGRSSDNTEAYMSGMVVGDASNIIPSGQTTTDYADTDRLAEGLLDLSGDGIITNQYGVTMIGGGRGTGLFRQTGGVYEQGSTSELSPFVVGNAGGFGTYLLGGGEAKLGKDMYIGGTFTNCLASGGYMATYGYPVNCHTATGVVQVTGGKLAVAGDLNMGWDGCGVLEIEGAGSQVSVGGNLVLSNTVVSAEISTSSTLKFTFDENGVSPIRVAGKLVNTTGTAITVDMGDYSGNRGSIPVLTYTGLEGPVPHFELTGDAASKARLLCNDSGCRVLFSHGTTFIFR